MTNLKSMKTAFASLAIAATLASTPAAAHDPDNTSDRNLRMIGYMELDPAKEKSWAEAWTDIQSMAKSSDYPYTEGVFSYRNKRWIITPLTNFGDVDGVMAARKEVAEDNGSKFESAINNFDSAIMKSNTFFVRYDPDMSYQPEGSEDGKYVTIENYSYKPGKEAEMKSVLKDYKKLNADVGSPYGYEVYWGMMGTDGNSITVVRSAENALEMAKRDTAQDKLMESESARGEKLFGRFLKVMNGSTTEHATFKPDMGINLPED